MKRGDGPPHVPVMDRFHAKVALDAAGCWIWTGAIGGPGYGGFTGVQTPTHRWGSAHRFAYRVFIGRIPPGYTIDHLCRVRACVNPAHLEAVTFGENTRRAWAARQRPDHYPCGHDRTDANTYATIATSQRVCLTCKRARGRAGARRRRMVANCQ